MKVLQLFVAIGIMIAISNRAIGVASTPANGDQDLINKTIENLRLEEPNIGLLLSKFSAQQKVPIGLEVSADDDFSRTRMIRLQIKHATLADALNSIVKQNPLYTWKIQDEVVNVFPVDAKRDPLLRNVLEARLEKFSIQPGGSRFNLRQSLITAPAIKTILTDHNVVPDLQTFMSRDFAPLGRGYSLEASNITVSALLNQVIRESQTKFWIVLRFGDRNQYFVLNL